MNGFIMESVRWVLPESLRQRCREPVYGLMNRRSLRRASDPGALQPGVKLYGLLLESSGVGASSRLLAAGCEAAGIPLSLDAVHSRGGQRIAQPHWEALLSHENTMDTNLFVFNADCSEAFLHQIGAQVLRGRRNIAHWSWELPEFPDRWLKSFRPYDEIWTLSEFCREAIAKKTSLPVHVIPYGVDPRPDERLRRADFGLPEERLLFLCMCDFRSIAGRKNPLGALEAYLRAFPEENDRCGLVLKLSGSAASAAGELDSLRARFAGRKDVWLLEGSYPQSRSEALIALCDVFISLHRAEGFGLPIAEAMALGKAVVVTGWGGNMDFCSDETACCVKYSLRNVGELAAPPYDAWQRWAEPDAEDAAHWLRRLEEDAALREEKARAGQRFIRTHYSPARCGAVIRKQLYRGKETDTKEKDS